MQFYKCLNCDDVALKLGKRDALLSCCDERMKKLIPGEVDAATEKHVPILHRDGNKIEVKVGEVEHPMTEEHFIEWIVVETETGFMTAYLTPKDKPEATFYTEENVVNVFAYCNLHGLWKSDRQ